MESRKKGALKQTPESLYGECLKYYHTSKQRMEYYKTNRKSEGGREREKKKGYTASTGR